MTIYFFVSSDLLLQEMGAKLESNGGDDPGGMIDSGGKEPLLIIDVVSVAIEPLGVVVGSEDDDEADTDEVGLTIVFIKRTGTSSVK